MRASSTSSRQPLEEIKKKFLKKEVKNVLKTHFEKAKIQANSRLNRTSSVTQHRDSGVKVQFGTSLRPVNMVKSYTRGPCAYSPAQNFGFGDPDNGHRYHQLMQQKWSESKNFGSTMDCEILPVRPKKLTAVEIMS